MNASVQAPIAPPSGPGSTRRSGTRVRLATVRSGSEGLALDVYAAVVAQPGPGEATVSLRMLEPTQILRFLAGFSPASGPESAGVCA